MLNFEKIFLTFMLYSIIGWIIEVFVTIIEEKKFVNRGFLVGPYCPIYGTGFILINVLLNKFVYNPIFLYVLIVLLASIIEYVVSLFMEGLFKARWWDYSARFLNINGRICLTNSLAFGLLGIIGIYYLNPFIESFINSFSNYLIKTLGITFLIFLIIDFVISFIKIYKYRSKIKLVNKDNTEEIKTKLIN